ncbi:hypothetical protein ACQKWADRAFT_129122 [Trichoderma austrokoningii]
MILYINTQTAAVLTSSGSILFSPYQDEQVPKYKMRRRALAGSIGPKRPFLFCEAEGQRQRCIKGVPRRKGTAQSRYLYTCCRSVLTTNSQLFCSCSSFFMHLFFPCSFSLFHAMRITCSVKSNSDSEADAATVSVQRGSRHMVDSLKPSVFAIHSSQWARFILASHHHVRITLNLKSLTTIHIICLSASSYLAMQPCSYLYIMLPVRHIQNMPRFCAFTTQLTDSSIPFLCFALKKTKKRPSCKRSR